MKLPKSEANKKHLLSVLEVESLPDEQVLALCDMQMESQQQEIFSDLLARQREGQLNDAEILQLDELMQVYRRGLVSKSKALKVAVERRLKPLLK
jgi:predicted RNA-binding protein associated with RNAse of E/G family